MTDDSFTEKRESLNLTILGEFNTAMDRFFTKVDEARDKLDMSDFDVLRALEYGYGDDIAAGWREWVSG